MFTLAEFDTAIDAAQTELKRLRAERDRFLTEACGYSIGQIFQHGGREHMVEKMTGATKESGVWLHCRRRTGTGTWSKGLHVIYHRVG